MPPDGHRSEGTLSLSEVPYAGAKPFAYFSASGKVSRCKSETASGSTRRNGYSPHMAAETDIHPIPQKNQIKRSQPSATPTLVSTAYPKSPRQPPKKESAPMTERKCDCPNCKCTIKEGDHAYAVHGKHYCCEACAHHHKDGAECSSKGCHCAHPK